jgi:hypothetical protein
MAKYLPILSRGKTENSKQKNFVRHGTKLQNAKSTSQSNEMEGKQGI